MKKVPAFLLAAMLLLSQGAVAEEVTTAAAPSYAHEANAEDAADLPQGVAPLPIDFSAGNEPQADGFKTDTDYDYEYEDPSLHVTVVKGRVSSCDYWIATIRIADASQLRTASAGGFNSSATIQGQALATRMNAVLAIDGDYFCYTGKGYIVREGEEYLNILDGERDVLAIDRSGDFHVFHLATSEDISSALDRDDLMNVFYFGPILVENGQVVENVTGPNMAYNEKRQRMAICQVGPLEYKAICCAGPARGSYGMTLQQFANLVAEQGVQTAYNLDGGDSTMMIFNGKKINDVRSTSTRKINDIVYFASAYTAE